MALPAAMVMSGLPHEQFQDDLMDIYQHGAILLSNPVSPTRPSSASSSSSTLSSVATEASYCPHHIQMRPKPGKTSTPNPPVRRPPRITRVSSDDSGFFANCDNSKTNLRKLTHYLDLIQKLEDQFLYRSPPEDSKSLSPPQVAESKEVAVKYQNRDLLDLGSNITSSWPMQPAVLSDKGYANLFQYSPKPKMVKCPIDDCGFEFPQY